jgi:hypothetical protein
LAKRNKDKIESDKAYIQTLLKTYYYWEAEKKLLTDRYDALCRELEEIRRWENENGRSKKH